jgi:uncharacterized radical SAM superfamily Fe-S cluster-containing enzyme
MWKPNLITRGDHAGIADTAHIETAADGLRGRYPGQSVPRGLPKTIRSICPECLAPIAGCVFEDSGAVVLSKECREHGVFTNVLSSDARFYRKMQECTFADEEGIRNSHVTGAANCPDACGLCSNHLSTACQVNIDLSTRCNMNCPVCFAGAQRRGP